MWLTRHIGDFCEHFHGSFTSVNPLLSFLRGMSTKYIKTTPVFWSEPANRLLFLRVFVTVFIAGVAAVFGTLSYTILKSYEKRIGDARYNVIANSALDAMTSDINEKSGIVLSLSKNMAYFEPNATKWPNVVMPGFYDSSIVLRNVAALDDLMFLPLVQPAQLSNFETFMYNYFDSESAIPAGAGVSPSGKGVYAYNASNVNGTYHDTTGATTQYESSNAILVPITQLLFTSYLTAADLALNIHSIPQAGTAIDAVMACSKTADYSVASGSCGRASSFMSLPFNTTAPAQSLHTMVFQPVYLSQNASQLVGFTAGGFDWLAQVRGMFADYRSGIKIVITNGASAMTYTTTGSDVRVASADDSHDADYNSYQRAAHLFSSSEGGASTTDASTAAYSVYVYPSDDFFATQRTHTPLWACIGSVILILLCYVKFIVYDRVVMRESTAKAAVLETKRRFVRFISHEIRTPLNAVHLGLEALTTEVRKGLEQILVAQSEGTGAKLGDLADMLRSWLELSVEMMGNSESAVDVLNDLLNYDKIEMGTLRLDFSAVPIWDIIQTTTVAFLPQAKQRNIHMTLDSTLHSEVDIEDGAGKKFVCVGDAARLAQVMRNLVSNAIKFTPNNGCIDIGVERIEQGIPHFHMVTPDDCSKLLEQPRAGSIRISVTDSGAGLSEAQLAKISAEGVQFNANELQAGKGSGLGMFITRGIIEQHGGKLTVASGGIGAGTTFAVELPLFHRTISPLWRSASSRFGAHRRVSPEAIYDLNLASSSADTEKSSSYTSKPVPRQILVGGPAGPRRILVVDDASSNRKMLMRILTSNGYACEQAEDGKQAIEMVRASIESGLGFYAITMDYEMPVMNGPTATKKLREMGCTIPIIGVTGNLLPDDVAFYKAQGANDVLAKPLSLAKFEEFMREHTLLVRRQVPHSGAGNEESFSEEDC